MTGVEFSRRAGVAVITLFRPDRLNAITTAMVEELVLGRRPGAHVAA